MGGAIAKGYRTVADAFDRHPFLWSLAVICLCWAPWFVICWPGTTDPFDTLDQLLQFYNVSGGYSPEGIDLIDPNVLLNNHHPVLHTLLLGSFVTVGSWLGSQSWGLFCFVLLQGGLFACSLAAAVSQLRRMSLPAGWCFAAVAVFAIAPVFPGWAINATKDVMFSAFFVFFVILLVRIVTGCFKLDGKGIACYVAVAAGLCLSRNNGAIVLAVTIPFLFMVRKSPVARKAALCSIGVVAAYAVFVSVILPSAGVSGGNVREMLSRPIQSVAALAASDPDAQSVDADDVSAVEAVFDVDWREIGGLYNPDNADPVKGEFSNSVTNEELISFLGAWVHMGFQHPLSYIKAFVHQTDGYWIPGTTGSTVWTRVECWGLTADEGIEDQYLDAGIVFEQIPAFENARSGLVSWYKAFTDSPFGLITDAAVCFWAGIACLILLHFKHAARRTVVPFVPFLTLFCVCLLSPLNGGVRYALPYIAAMPLLCGFAVCSVRRSCVESLKERKASVALGHNGENAIG